MSEVPRPVRGPRMLWDVWPCSLQFLGLLGSLFLFLSSANLLLPLIATLLRAPQGFSNLLSWLQA